MFGMEFKFNMNSRAKSANGSFADSNMSENACTVTVMDTLRVSIFGISVINVISIINGIINNVISDIESIIRPELTVY